MKISILPPPQTLGGQYVKVNERKKCRHFITFQDARFVLGPVRIRELHSNIWGFTHWSQYKTLTSFLFQTVQNLTTLHLSTFSLHDYSLKLSEPLTWFYLIISSLFSCYIQVHHLFPNAHLEAYFSAIHHKQFPRLQLFYPVSYYSYSGIPKGFQYLSSYSQVSPASPFYIFAMNIDPTLR